MKKIYTLLLTLAFSGSFASQACAACAANFTSTNVANVFNFTDASTSTSGTIVTWFWNFGDFSAPGTTQNPTHTYAVCGVYNVSLTIGTSLFCSNTYTGTITVNSGMIGSFTSTVDTSSGTANFNGSPTAPNVDYFWDFGDGNTGTGAFTSNTYSASGTYYVCLTVADTGGICTDTYCDSVIVYISPTACTSTFTFNDNGDGNVNFTASPFDFDITYSWDYGDGTTGTGAAAFHTYPSAGAYYACLTAVDSATMCTSVYCDSIILVADPTACNFTFSYFDNDGTVGFTANPPSFDSYTWDFGDGQTGTGTATSNTYATGGTYYVCATVTDGFNMCSNTFCDSVLVSITGITENTGPELYLTVYPNPAEDQVTISYWLQKPGTVTIELLDILGSRIAENKFETTSGRNEMVLKTETLAKGAYLVKVIAGNSNSAKLIIKQ